MMSTAAYAGSFSISVNIPASLQNRLQIVDAIWRSS
jgi:hypothetical protein